LNSAGEIIKTAVSASAAWGSITGTLSSQTDLQTALNAKLNLAGGTMTGGLGITSMATTGQPSFMNFTNSVSDALSLRFTEELDGSIPADVWQLRLGGTTGRPLVISSFSTPIAQFSNGNTALTGNLTVSGNTTLGDASADTLTINPATITAANIPSGTIVKNIDLQNYEVELSRSLSCDLETEIEFLFSDPGSVVYPYRTRWFGNLQPLSTKNMPDNNVNGKDNFNPNQK
jgi:hypothetical protein